MSNLLFPVLISALIIMLASLVGKIFVWKKTGNLLKKNTQYLTTFAGGVFVVLVLSMLKETFHLAQNTGVAIGSILFGVLLIEIIMHIMPSKHHQHSFPLRCHKKHSCIDARRMMISDAFHNLGDGILIVNAFVVDMRVGIIATLGIFLHEIVQEISEFFVLKEAGYSDRKALGYNFLIAGTILIGIGLSFILSSVDWLMAPLMGMATGGFIYMLLRDLIPHTISHAKRTKTITLHMLMFLSGIFLMWFINSVIPHTHHHNDSVEHLQEIKK